MIFGRQIESLRQNESKEFINKNEASGSSLRMRRDCLNNGMLNELTGLLRATTTSMMATDTTVEILRVKVSSSAMLNF